MNLVKFYLPPQQNCSLKFMQAILNGKKDALLQEEVDIISVPTFPELSVSNLLEKIVDNDEIMKFLPDKNEKARIDKTWLWHVVNHFNPAFVAKAKEAATKSRIA